jgi:hypothetical protein
LAATSAEGLPLVGAALSVIALNVPIDFKAPSAPGSLSTVTPHKYEPEHNNPVENRLERCAIILPVAEFREENVMSDNGSPERKFHLMGWLLFLVCAGFFIASGVAEGNIVSIAGSAIFLVGCVVFIIPLMMKRNPNKDN